MTPFPILDGLDASVQACTLARSWYVDMLAHDPYAELTAEGVIGSRVSARWASWRRRAPSGVASSLVPTICLNLSPRVPLADPAKSRLFPNPFHRGNARSHSSYITRTPTPRTRDAYR